MLGFVFAFLAPLIYLANPIIFFLQALYLLPGDISLNAITMLFCRVGGFVSLILGFVLSVAGIITSAVKHKRGIGFGAAEGSISIDIQEVPQEQWNDTVWDKDIEPRMDELYKKPRYTKT